jgi:hypothetical protein
MRSVILRFSSLILMLLLGAGAAGAQLAATSIDNDPAAPVDGDMVAFTVTVQAPASCFTDPTQLMVGEMDGTSADLILPACADVGLPNDTAFTFQAQLGQFAAGTYTVNVFRNTDFPSGAPVGSEILTVGPPSSGGIGGENNGSGLCGPDTCYKSTANACAVVNPPGPCNLILDITNAINGAPTLSNWKYYLDTNFTRWVYKMDNSVPSENEPVMAAAVALWVSPNGANPTVIDPSTNKAFNAYNWWSTFLGCQTGTSYCPNVAANTTHQYFNGAEILSATYGGYVTLAVGAVALWAQKHPTQDTLAVGAAAKHFLQITIGLWSLGAGPGPAQSLVALNGTTYTPCSSQSFQMPFLALAGARGIVDDPCHDDRGPIFAKAIGYPIGACQQPTWNNRLQEALQCAWSPDSAGTNVWGVSTVNGQHLQGFIGIPKEPPPPATAIGEGDWNTAMTTVNVLKGVRFIDEYHFVSWPGERATVLYKNPNTNTVPIFALDYTTKNETATELYPWKVVRENSTPGYGTLLGAPGSPVNGDGTPLNPDGAKASNCYLGGTGCGPQNPPTTQSMSLNHNNATMVLYMIKLSPTADASFDH